MLYVKKEGGGLLSKLSRRLKSGLMPALRAEVVKNSDLLRANLKHTYGDQKGQVEFLINNVFDYQNRGLPKAGFFVDLACADGVWISNTYFLERCLGWRGLLFEPNPGYRNSIEKYRVSPLVTSCVTDVRGETVRFRIDNGMLGGIVSEETDNSDAVRGGELKSAKIIELPTTSLEYELDKIGAPKEIGFLSLDIEGAEWIALRSFPFDKYVFRCMAIERPSESLDLLLDKNGYRQVSHLSFDVIYVHEKYLSEVNFDPIAKFAFTPNKDW